MVTSFTVLTHLTWHGPCTSEAGEMTTCTSELQRAEGGGGGGIVLGRVASTIV